MRSPNRPPHIAVISVDHPVFAGYVLLVEHELAIFVDLLHMAHWRHVSTSGDIDEMLEQVRERGDLETSPAHRRCAWRRNDALHAFADARGAVGYALHNGQRRRARTSPRASTDVDANELYAQLNREPCRDADCDGEAHMGLLYETDTPPIGAPGPNSFAYAYHIGFAPLRIVPPDPIVLANQW